MHERYFFAIDFDGTVTDVDIIDAVLEAFARPEWCDAEALWDQGIIGSRECLERQMAMIDRPLNEVLAYVDRFTIDRTFKKFIAFLEARKIPFAIVSDGFQVFIERLLVGAGIGQVPVLANRLWEENGRLATAFPYTDVDCSSANCKCMAVSAPTRDRSLILVGDGRSDFCLAHRASHAFTKNKLTGYCREHHIPHSPFDSFEEIAVFLRSRTFQPLPPLTVEAGKDRS